MWFQFYIIYPSVRFVNFPYSICRSLLITSKKRDFHRAFDIVDCYIDINIDFYDILSVFRLFHRCQNVHADKRHRREQNYCVHCADGRIVTEKVYAAIQAFLYGVHHFRRKALICHFFCNAAKSVIFEERGSVGPRKQAERFLQAAAEVGYRHICAADEAVCRRNQSSRGRSLPVCCQKHVYRRRKRRAEHGQNHHV